MTVPYPWLEHMQTEIDAADQHYGPFTSSHEALAVKNIEEAAKEDAQSQREMFA